MKYHFGRLQHYFDPKNFEEIKSGTSTTNTVDETAFNKFIEHLLFGEKDDGANNDPEWWIAHHGNGKVSYDSKST